MTSLHPYQQQIIDSITNGAHLAPLWFSGRRMGKSWRAKLVREYCEQHGIKVVEINKDGINGKEVSATWHDECQDSWVAQQFSCDSKPIWFGFDLATSEE